MHKININYMELRPLQMIVKNVKQLQMNKV